MWPLLKNKNILRESTFKPTIQQITFHLICVVWGLTFFLYTRFKKPNTFKTVINPCGHSFLSSDLKTNKLFCVTTCSVDFQLLLSLFSALQWYMFYSYLYTRQKNHDLFTKSRYPLERGDFWVGGEKVLEKNGRDSVPLSFYSDVSLYWSLFEQSVTVLGALRK